MWGGKPSDEDRRIVLQIPEGQLETLTLSTTNEDISVPALSVTGRMELSNNGGNILLENAAVGDPLPHGEKWGHYRYHRGTLRGIRHLHGAQKGREQPPRAENGGGENPPGVQQ